MSIHFQLAQLIRDGQKANPWSVLAEIDNLSDEELIRQMFKNIRYGNGEMRGLQLNHCGLEILSHFFKSYQVVFPNQATFSSRHILYMDRICKRPWYATPYLPITITFFEPDLAMRAKLVGDLDVLLGAFES